MCSWEDGWFSAKESICQCRRCKRCSFDVWWRGCHGKGNGNPLQYFCLGNPIDRGAWRATIRGGCRIRYDLATKQQEDGWLWGWKMVSSLQAAQMGEEGKLPGSRRVSPPRRLLSVSVLCVSSLYSGSLLPSFLPSAKHPHLADHLRSSPEI